ncbi:hypothetical protein PhCBS80983_g00567 [Powellomyces hirtus]|uniref:Uncharacterized protein n=1 Tax=Powellomyces hirtus TaxID=109895 RepID=A0A507EGI5_9FUNG|nr:hypothetical protein PhCBS80983_g00567 [Powellomyces hirtus]
MDQRKSVRDALIQSIGFCPKGKASVNGWNALGWLYAARGYYKTHDYHSVIECVAPALRNDRTNNNGNDTDWQPLVELLMDNAAVKLT